MSQSTSTTSSQAAQHGSSSGSGSELTTSQGRTSIADQVVSKIAGVAVRDVAGVHALGGGAARAFGQIRERIPGASTNVSQGVSVEVGERQAAVDVTIVAEYGASIADVARGVRRNVISAVEGMTGLEVTEVNVEVTDIHIPGQDDDEDGEEKSSRVQ
ncbi:Asp23/Gls24 family envelope stress response protein [Pseudokineococcus marinus]|uniref:Asp23/Gls24 family envelope stress response protein n=1 Tax=Pseudokineococcus marinus TaxID=351215 RepID=A0A849BVW7_9ACTN|nr:Asp23/Gls24 family envelope stress response protein [Pseudokineococcus marinus]NNH23636.1 Asp23/Gls24 family envelope stress response protein [Pseudokineococcus marinus]